jgi:hypothetical protein
MAQGGKRPGAGRPQVFPWNTMAIGESFIADYNVSSTSKHWIKKFPHLSFKITRVKRVEIDRFANTETSRTAWCVTRLS